MSVVSDFDCHNDNTIFRSNKGRLRKYLSGYVVGVLLFGKNAIMIDKSIIEIDFDAVTAILLCNRKNLAGFDICHRHPIGRIAMGCQFIVFSVSVQFSSYPGIRHIDFSI